MKTELTPEDRERIEQWANSKRFYSYEDRRNLMEGAEYENKYQREDRLSLLVAFGALVQMKEISNLTEAAKHFLWDYDNVKNSLKK